MTNQIAKRLIVAGLLTAVGLWAQAPAEFVAASIKPAAPMANGRMMVGMRGGPGTPSPGQMTFINVSLADIVQRAYDVQELPGLGPGLDVVGQVRHLRQGSGGCDQGAVQRHAAESPCRSIQAGSASFDERVADLRAAGCEGRAEAEGIAPKNQRTMRPPRLRPAVRGWTVRDAG